jgi:Arc/MetJ-type ribon-helix-helix transcriptional regulator
MYLTADEHAQLRGLVIAGEFASIADVLRQSIWSMADERGLVFLPRERNASGRPAGYRHRPETIQKMREAARRR